jgi:DNA-binding response OmpR family regulator
MAYLLMVDDNPQTQRYLARIVRLRSQHELGLAGSGQEAIEAIARRRPDLVFLDLYIPGIDGLELLRRLRRHWATAAIPVVIHSAVPFDEATRIRLRPVPTDGLLEFPVEASELLRIIDAALDRSRRQVRRWQPPSA